MQISRPRHELLRSEGAEPSLNHRRTRPFLGSKQHKMEAFATIRTKNPRHTLNCLKCTSVVPDALLEIPRNAIKGCGKSGYKPRQLKTRVGNLELLIPQDREGTFQTELFEKYQRHEKALVLSLMQMYLEGVSTRKVSDITEKLCGSKFSKSTISNLTKQLDSELSAWRNRPLEMPYCYVMVDALYEYVRINHQVLTQGVLIVKGIRADGKREVLAVTVADTESEASYQELFRGLKDRGLKGVRLVISDDHS